MIAYSFDKDTKEYIGEEICQINPIASKREKKEIYLLPANCTMKKPPEKQEGKTVVFENYDWIQVSDYRGKIAYNKDNIFTINYIGDLKKGDVLLTEEQIVGLNNGTLVFQDGEIIEYVKPISLRITEFEEQIEQLNTKIIRDIRILLNPYASQEEKQEAQKYFNDKILQIDDIKEEINKLKNNKEGK